MQRTRSAMSGSSFRSLDSRFFSERVSTRSKLANFLRALTLQQRRRFKTSVFVRRLILEQEIVWGLVSGLLAVALFYTMVLLTQQQASRTDIYDLEQAYKDAFLFDEVEDIHTLDSLQDFLNKLSERTRRMQVVSSERFQEQESQIRLWSKFQRFDRPKNIETSDLNLRVDSREFTFTAWVRRPTAKSTGYILRKPIGLTDEDAVHTCWAWYIDDPPRFEYGFHDYGITDLGDTEDAEVFQERVEASGNWSEVNDEAHFETVVVTQDNIAFFRDAVLKSSIPLRRPVTDCEGSSLFLGGGGRGGGDVGGGGMWIGEVTFFARSLSTVEMEEIMLSGFTLDSATTGRLPIHREDSDIDAVIRAHRSQFDDMDKKLDGVVDEVVLGRILSQSQDMVIAEDGGTPTLLPPKQQDCLREWPPCRLIRNVQETLADDDVIGKQYFDLIPTSVRNGVKKVLLGRDLPRAELLHYDLPSFPSWRNSSVSFSMWMRPGRFGHLLAKHPDMDARAMCWSVHLNESGVSVETLEGTATVLFPNWMEGDHSELSEGAAQIRHLGLVLDAGSNTLSAFLDGSLLGVALFPARVRVDELDCPSSANSYLALAHRAPGGSPFEGEIQDFRMYVGEALSAKEMHAIASVETASGPVRECLLPEEAQDAGWKDVNGLDCSWYQQAKLKNVAVCNSKAVQRQCPVACGMIVTCYTPGRERASAPATSAWERIMLLKPFFGHKSSFCSVRGIDSVAQCRALQAAHRRSHSHGPPAHQVVLELSRTEVHSALKNEVNVTDCDLLEDVIQPACSFDLHQSFSASLEASGEFSVLFWMKPLYADDKRKGTFFPMITIYSAVAPPVPFVQITQDANSKLVFRVFSGCEGHSNITLHIVENLFQNEWVQFAISVGPPSPVDGLSQVVAMVNSRSVSDFATLAFCSHNGGQRTIEGFSVVQKETLISPIQFHPVARSVRELQEHYYQQRLWYKKREGPALTDFEREQSVIRHPRSTYEMPATLIGPPIVMQTRGSSAECENDVSAKYRQKLWSATIQGPTCSDPFVCWDSLFSTPDELYTCRAKESPSTFFGREPFQFRGHEVFAEFLPTVTEATTLVRKGDIYQADNFIDSESKTVTLLLVLLSFQHGIASNVKVISEVGLRVKAEYELMYLQEIKGEKLWVCRTLVVIILILIACSLLDVSMQLLEDVRKTNQKLIAQEEEEEKHMRREISKFSSKDDESAEEPTSVALLMRSNLTAYLTPTVRELIFDAVVMVILPLAYVSLRIVRIEASEGDYQMMLGEEEGLTGVPWANRDVSLDDKVQTFFDRVARVKEFLVREEKMALLGFMSELMLLLRVLLATKLHPRIAVLVQTLRVASDDLLHFIALFMIVFVGFAVIAHVNLGGYRHDFATIEDSFSSLYMMMMGETIPPRQGPRFQEMADRFGFGIFVGLFSFIVFFVLLNFLIAIVVEGFLKIKAALEDDETEQDFFSDLWSVINIKMKSRKFGWPGHAELISKLENLAIRNFSCKDLCLMFPRHDPVMVIKLFNHYWPQHALRSSASSAGTLPQRTNNEVIEEVERRTACLLRQPVPTPLERAIVTFHQTRKSSRKLRSNKSSSSMASSSFKLDATEAASAASSLKFAENSKESPSRLSRFNSFERQAKFSNSFDRQAKFSASESEEKLMMSPPSLDVANPAVPRNVAFSESVNEAQEPEPLEVWPSGLTPNGRTTAYYADAWPSRPTVAAATRKPSVEPKSEPVEVWPSGHPAPSSANGHTAAYDAWPSRSTLAAATGQSSGDRFSEVMSPDWKREPIRAPSLIPPRPPASSGDETAGDMASWRTSDFELASPFASHLSGLQAPALPRSASADPRETFPRSASADPREKFPRSASADPRETAQRAEDPIVEPTIRHLLPLHPLRALPPSLASETSADGVQVDAQLVIGTGRSA